MEFEVRINYKSELFLSLKLTFFVFFLMFEIFSNICLSQTLPVITNSRGDTIAYTWPFLIDSLCNKSEVIISFKPEALKLNNLCWTLPAPVLTQSTINNNDLIQYYSYLYSEEFQIDTLIADINLSNTIKAFGGIYFKRLSTVSPCRDTLSLSRYGDTVYNRSYLNLLLKLNNDSTIINACTYLTYLYQNLLLYAQPNFCGHNSMHPLDSYYDHPTYNETGFWSEFLNAELAWDYQTGSPGTKVAVIDCGIDYEHCDLGSDKVPELFRFNYKSLPNEDPKIIRTLDDCLHGTMMTGIIGGLTNRANVGCSSSGIAGIAGGWVNEFVNNKGCTIIGLKAGKGSNDNNVYYSTSDVYKAIIEAAADHTDPERFINHAFGSHILNLSLGFTEEEIIYDWTLEQAINFAYENNVNIVAARGNPAYGAAHYPATYEQTWVTNVGALGINHKVYPGSAFGKYIDFLAPAFATYTTAKNNTFEWATQSSTSTALVSGCIALLRSEFSTNPKYSNIVPEAIDFENMLKASCIDLNYKRNEND